MRFMCGSLALVPATPRNRGCGSGAGHKKTADPRLGTSGVRLVVPPHFAGSLRNLPWSARRWTRCSGSITGADRPGWTTRRRLLSGSNDPAVRGGAPRSYRLALPVPLRSNRGSLAHPRQGHVLIIASLSGCWPYRSNLDRRCQYPSPLARIRRGLACAVW